VFHAGPTIQTAFIYMFFPPEEEGGGCIKQNKVVLSNEMDQALKRRVGFYEKSARPRSSESPSKHESATRFFNCQ
jgi:hypothetical protein